MPHSVFLSHTARDKPFVRRLARDLTLAGITVWLDDAEIKIGDSLLSMIEDGISGSDERGKGRAAKTLQQRHRLAGFGPLSAHWLQA